MISVFLADVNKIKTLPNALFEEKMPKRFKKSKRFKNENDRLLCLGAGYLLWDILHINEGEIFYGEHEKPYTKDTQFSLSHSEKYSALAYHKDKSTEIGMDIEKVCEIAENVQKRVFSPAEIKWAKENEHGFVVLWTIKESVMKANGKGLSLGALSIDALSLINEKAIQIEGKSYYAKYKIYGDYVISVCAEKSFDEIEIVEID